MKCFIIKGVFNATNNKIKNNGLLYMVMTEMIVPKLFRGLDESIDLKAKFRVIVNVVIVTENINPVFIWFSSFLNIANARRNEIPKAKIK